MARNHVVSGTLVEVEGDELVDLCDLEPTHWKALDLPVAYQEETTHETEMAAATF